MHWNRWVGIAALFMGDVWHPVKTTLGTKREPQTAIRPVANMVKKETQLVQSGFLASIEGFRALCIVLVGERQFLARSGLP